MSECWPEGSLRAYHDGELPPAEMERVAAHLAVCADCEALADEIAGRASRVAALLGALPEPDQVIWMPRSAVTPRRIPATRRWVATAAALAAGLALAAWLAPKRQLMPQATVPGVDQAAGKTLPGPVELPVVQPGQSGNLPAIQPDPVGSMFTAGHRAGARPAALLSDSARPAAARPVRRALPKQVFFSLDDEPIETGFVVRVALGPAEIPADVVFGADGRAHAIRLVSNSTKY